MKEYTYENSEKEVNKIIKFQVNKIIELDLIDEKGLMPSFIRIHNLARLMAMDKVEAFRYAIEQFNEDTTLDKREFIKFSNETFCPNF